MPLVHTALAVQHGTVDGAWGALAREHVSELGGLAPLGRAALLAFSCPAFQPGEGTHPAS
jgi:hypothetical protein